VRKRAVLVVALLLLCAVSHFLIPPHEHQWHEFLFKVTYVPIILAALWFGLRGGLAISATTSALYLAHVQWQLGGHATSDNLGHTLDIALYNGIALVTGLLAQAQTKARRRAERLAEEQSSLRRRLQESYQALQLQTEELLQASERLRQSERLAALGEVTAVMAHEIRNPLNGISGAAEIVGREDVTPTVRAEFAGILRKETARLNQAVHNILNLARDRKPEVRDTSLQEVAQRVVRLANREAEQRSVSLTDDIPAGLRFETDSLLLEHILLNLVLNGIQATPAGGAVTLAGRKNADSLVLAVRDTGPGIPPEVQARMFTPFFTTKPSGTGLGLAVARRFAHALGGEIRVQSAPGQETEFSLEIPLKEVKNHGQENPSGRRQ